MIILQKMIPFPHPTSPLSCLFLDCLASWRCSRCAKCWWPSRVLHPGDESRVCQRRAAQGRSLLSPPELTNKEGITPGHSPLSSLALMFSGKWGNGASPLALLVGDIFTMDVRLTGARSLAKPSGPSPPGINLQALLKFSFTSGSPGSGSGSIQQLGDF